MVEINEWLWEGLYTLKKLYDKGKMNLLEQYSMAMARWIQIENVTSEYGLVSKHPTAGTMIGSPFVSMAQGYLKQANMFYQQIFSIVAANSTEPVTGNPQDDLMEQLLNM